MTPAGTLQLWIVSSLALVLLQTVVLTGVSLFLRGFGNAQVRVQQMLGAIAQERTLLRTVIDNIPDAVYAKDAAGRRTLANKADVRLLGARQEAEVLGMTGAEKLPDDMSAQLLAEDQGVLTTGEPVVNRDQSMTALDGRQIWLLTSKLPLRGPAGAIVGLVGIDRDVTKSRRAEEALRESELRFRSIFERSAISLWEEDISELRAALNALAKSGVSDLRGYLDAHPEFVMQAIRMIKVVDVNDATLRLYEAESKQDLLGSLQITLDLENKDTICSFRQSIISIAEGQRYYQRESTARTLRGNTLDVVISSYIPEETDHLPHMLVNVIDATGLRKAERERAKLEEQLRQSQKMESVGQLAGGVAHDINNLLTPILGFSELLLADIAPGDARAEDVKQIRGAAERARDLTRQLLAFSRKQVLSLEVVDLRDIVARFEKLVRRTIREDIEIHMRVPKWLGSVRADRSQIEQVLMNLVVNAQDAMPEGGALTMELQDTALDEADALVHPEVSPGPYVQLSVSDSGSGMDPATMERIFEPFFTTKSKGTGLGLSTAYGIVRQHGGSLQVRSQPGRGSVFLMYLPCVPEDVERPPRALAREPAAAEEGGETVLVVEDMADVRELACAVLARGGYRVIAAENGARALEIAQKRGLPIHLLLTDVIMPGMNGDVLYQHMARLRPGLKVLYMSGYIDGMIAHRGVLKEGVSLIQKPFSIDALKRAVRMALDQCE